MEVPAAAGTAATKTRLKSGGRAVVHTDSVAHAGEFFWLRTHLEQQPGNVVRACSAASVGFLEEDVGRQAPLEQVESSLSWNQTISGAG